MKITLSYELQPYLISHLLFSCPQTRTFEFLSKNQIVSNTFVLMIQQNRKVSVLRQSPNIVYKKIN